MPRARGRMEGVLTLLDQDEGHALTVQEEPGGEAHQSATDHQHGCMFLVKLRLALSKLCHN